MVAGWTVFAAHDHSKKPWALKDYVGFSGKDCMRIGIKMKSNQELVVKQLLVTGKLHCENCEKQTKIIWEEWICDLKTEHEACSDDLCNPRDEEFTCEGLDIDKATRYILRKEVHPRCNECQCLYGW